MWAYTPPRWLPDGHTQTIYPALWGTRQRLFGTPLHRQRWAAPDGDFIDVDRESGFRHDDSPRPLLVLFHGLEGSSTSHYSLGFRWVCRQFELDFAVPHFRGCSGELNLAPRAYHSGDATEIDWILKRFANENLRRDVYAVGVSLGGNALMRWAGEVGAAAPFQLKALAAVCAPLDLACSGKAMGKGFNRYVYTRMFLRSMVPKALSKLQQHPGLFDAAQVTSARTLYDFDNAFTAPLHGYRSTEDYWRRASAKPVLRHIRLPALLLNAMNDPFVPHDSLPTHADVGSCVTLWQPADGGHVGFPASTMRADKLAPQMDMPEAVYRWLLAH